MSSTYEFFLLDDAGRRIAALSGYYFFSYARSINGLGTLEMGFVYNIFKEQVFPFFLPDRRIDVWRSPADGIPMRREQTYLLRKFAVSTRSEDNIQTVTLYARDAKDLLNRRVVIQAAGTSYTRKTNFIDDMMKEIVREQMLYGYAVDADGVLDNDRAWPAGEFDVQGDTSLGPSVTQSFAERKVMDVLKDLSSLSFQKSNEDITNHRIYFDVVPYDLDTSGLLCINDESDPSQCILDENGEPILDESSTGISGGVGFRFETFADLRGIDRTGGLVFSIENNNLKEPSYSENHLDEITSAIIKGFGRGDSRAWDKLDSSGVTSSRWNRVETFVDASTEPDQTNLSDYGYEPLNKNRAREDLEATFLNVRGSADTPQSLYGVDWDLGDLLPVEYAGKRKNIELVIVYVAMDENGKENITGRSEINNR